MTGDLILLILFFFLSIIFSFLCSVWEAVLLSIPPSFVEIKKQEGADYASTLQQFKNNIDRPLSAILTLNTIAHTVGAIMVGATASKIWGGTWVTSFAVPALMTLAILILSEIIPKTWGANSWKNLAGFTVKSLKAVIFILSPLVWLSQLITKKMKKDKSKSVLSRADFSAMAEIGAKEGIFKEGESKIIRNLLAFNKVRAEDIMTPRTVVITADENMTISTFYEENRNLRFSRIPIYKESKDDIASYFLKGDLLDQMIQDNGNLTLKEIARPISIVHESMILPDLFNKLMEKREHIALVVDEFGGMAGVVSMEDVIETLLGLEIVDELDNTADMQALARKNWEKRARDLGIIEKDKNEE